MTNSSQSTPSTRPHPDKLRIDFIGMAFALAIGELGLEIGRFYLEGIRLRDHLYLVTHILLAIYIIASSWIGWQLSKSRGNEEILKDTFSLSFIILLLDLLLVIFYFIIVKSIEKNPESPSCQAQTLWSNAIFITYIFWDIFTKLIVENSNGKVRFEEKKDISKYFKRAYQAPICLAISLALIWPFHSSNTVKNVVCVDILLISVFMLFRGMKAFDHQLKKVPLYIAMPSLLFIITYLILIDIIPI